MLPCVAEAKRELDVNDEFEEDEVGVGHDVVFEVGLVVFDIGGNRC